MAGAQISHLKQKGDPALGTQIASASSCLHFQFSAPALDSLGLITRALSGLELESTFCHQTARGQKQDKVEVGETLLTRRAESEHTGAELKRLPAT